MFHKYVHFVQLLDVSLDLRQLGLTRLFLSFQADCVNLAYVSYRLVLSVHFFPLFLQGFTELHHFLFRHVVSKWDIEYLSYGWSLDRLLIMLYQLFIFSLIFDRYQGTLPKSDFESQLTYYFGALGTERMFQTALETTKFLFDFKPKTGFSVCLGTGCLRWLHSQEYCLTGGKLLSPIVPVCFNLKLSGDGFLSPLRYPNVLASPVLTWAECGYLNSPLILLTQLNDRLYSWFGGGSMAEGGTRRR